MSCVEAARRKEQCGVLRAARVCAGRACRDASEWVPWEGALRNRELCRASAVRVLETKPVRPCSSSGDTDGVCGGAQDGRVLECGRAGTGLETAVCGLTRTHRFGVQNCAGRGLATISERTAVKARVARRLRGAGDCVSDANLPRGTLCIGHSFSLHPSGRHWRRGSADGKRGARSAATRSGVDRG